VLGAAGGLWVATAWIIAEARSDRYIFHPDQAKIRMLPIPLGAAAGSILGYQNSDRMWASVRGGALGAAIGIVGGTALGSWLGGDSESAWSGGIIGGALGLLAGSVVGGGR